LILNIYNLLRQILQILLKILILHKLPIQNLTHLLDRPSILTFRLVESLQSIDDTHWIQQAQQARRDSELVGTDRFTQEIIRLAALDESSDA
jgi:hypothetical protein